MNTTEAILAVLGLLSITRRKLASKPAAVVNHMSDAWVKYSLGDPTNGLSTSSFDKLVRGLRSLVGERVDQVVDILQRQGLTGAMLEDQVAAVFADEKFSSGIMDLMRPYLERSVVTGGEAGARVVRSTFNHAKPTVQGWIDGATTRLAEDVRNGTTTRVQDLIGNAVEEGKSVGEITRDLKEMGFPIERARTIARTETARAYIRGGVEAWKQSGRVSHKRWSLSPNACPTCQAIAANFKDTPVPLDQDFVEQGGSFRSGEEIYVFDYEALAGPPAHPNCRCSLRPVLKERT